MGNMVANVYAKSNYDRLCINKALGFCKSDNNKNKIITAIIFMVLSSCLEHREFTRFAP